MYRRVRQDEQGAVEPTCWETCKFFCGCHPLTPEEERQQALDNEQCKETCVLLTKLFGCIGLGILAIYTLSLLLVRIVPYGYYCSFPLQLPPPDINSTHCMDYVQEQSNWTQLPIMMTFSLIFILIGLTLLVLFGLLCLLNWFDARVRAQHHMESEAVPDDGIELKTI